MLRSVTFPTGTVHYYIPGSFASLPSIINSDTCFIITDSHIDGLYGNLLDGYQTIVIPAGETHKTLATITYITDQLIAREAHRKSILVGMGGGVVTDITGMAASIYMRGIPFGFIPTTLLGMADAAIGGKNGVNSGLHKNLLGTIRQPEFILFDTQLLDTLPDTEWSNGFAEIIKYACLFDPQLFEELETGSLLYYQNNKEALTTIVSKCVNMKNAVVLEDEQEKNKRKLLNFGHTAGHAIETLYALPHGQAVAIGMLIALTLSPSLTNINPSIKVRVRNILGQYKLPTAFRYDVARVMDVLRGDKKRNGNNIDFIVINDIGDAMIATITFDTVQSALEKFLNDSNC